MKSGGAARDRGEHLLERDVGVAVAEVRVAEVDHRRRIIAMIDDRERVRRAVAHAADVDAQLVQAERQRGHRDRGVTDAVGIAVARHAVDELLVDEHVRGRPGARRDPADIERLAGDRDRGLPEPRVREQRGAGGHQRARDVGRRLMDAEVRERRRRIVRRIVAEAAGGDQQRDDGKPHHDEHRPSGRGSVTWQELAKLPRLDVTRGVVPPAASA